jgi:hypothetical protein
MLFSITYTPRSASEEQDKRMLKLFTNWQPPAGVEIKCFYDYADMNGGFLVVEASSVEPLLEMTAPWAAFFAFSTRPIIPVEASAVIQGKAFAWRDSIR